MTGELEAELTWQRDLSLMVGVRVKVDTLQGTVEGTVARCDGSSVQVCGHRRGDTSESVGVCRLALKTWLLSTVEESEVVA